MFDSHCHLNFKAFADDAHLIAKAMADESVSGLVVGCDSHSSRTAIDLAQTYPHLWASVGLHPVHVLDDPWDDAVMKNLALEERVVAIGEVGLDFYRFPEDSNLKEQYIESQYVVFTAAIELAQMLDKPLVIHSRQAYDEILEALEKHFVPGNTLRGTIHCYMGDWQQAQRFLALGFMLGFTGVITYADASPSMLEVVAHAPLDRLLIETDAPYLTPEPYRTDGKKQNKKIPRNIPQYSREAARKIAELQGKTTEEIISITQANSERLFGIKIKETA